MGKKKRDKTPEVSSPVLPEADVTTPEIPQKKMKKKKKDQLNLKPLDTPALAMDGKIPKKKKKGQQQKKEIAVSKCAAESLGQDDNAVTENQEMEIKKSKKVKGNVLSENSSKLQQSNADSADVTDETKKQKQKKKKMKKQNGALDNKKNVVHVHGSDTPASEPSTEDTASTETSSDKDSSKQGIKEKKGKKKKKQNQENRGIKSAATVNDTKSNEESNQSSPAKGLENKKKRKRKLDKGKIESAESDEPFLKKKFDSEEQSEVNGQTEEKGDEEEVKKVDIGQWSSSAFEDSERQQKFIRLLGGKKKEGKDFSGIQQKLFSIGMADIDDFKSDGGSGSGNVSMDWQEQNNYIQKMESQFKRARGMHFNRGRGFGYKKPAGRGGGGGEGKKFNIDVSNVKSRKFD